MEVNNTIMKSFVCIARKYIAIPPPLTNEPLYFGLSGLNLSLVYLPGATRSAPLRFALAPGFYISRRRRSLDFEAKLLVTRQMTHVLMTRYSLYVDRDEIIRVL